MISPAPANNVPVRRVAQSLSERFVKRPGADEISAKNLPNSRQLSGVLGISQPDADGQQAGENNSPPQ
jgi:hypothetical protein